MKWLVLLYVVGGIGEDFTGEAALELCVEVSDGIATSGGDKEGFPSGRDSISKGGEVMNVQATARLPGTEYIRERKERGPKRGDSAEFRSVEL